MVRKMLLPIIKRYKGLFISMVIISALAVAMLTGLTSIVNNTYQAYLGFKEEYGTADITLLTDLTQKKNLDVLKDIDGVKEVNGRLGLPAYLQTDGRISTAMICTYNENDFSKHYVISETEASKDAINLTIEKRYAKNNNLNVGDSVDMYFYGTKTKCFIKEIVYTPETIYVLANKFMKPDNTGFGYVFLSDGDYAKVIKSVSKNNFEIAITDMLDGLVRNGMSRYSNQVLIKCVEGSDVKEVMQRCQDALKQKVKIKSATAFEDSPPAQYMLKFSETFSRLAIVVPAMFYIIMLIVVIIFLNQMVLYLTTDIGILTALGVAKSDILRLLSVFSLCMTGCSLVVGYVIGKGLSILGSVYFGDIYQIPHIPTRLNVLLIAVAIIVTALVGQLAVLFATKRVLKITPKDAMINNETNKSSIPKTIVKLLKNAKTNTSLNFSIAFHNPRRIIASIFCVVAATAIMTFSVCFETSEDIAVHQATEGAYAFDMHYLCNDEESSKVYNELSNLDGIDKIEKIHYATMKMVNGDKEIEMNVCGMQKDCTLFKIPDEKGELGSVKVEGEGIWLNKDYAEQLGVGVGDYIYINGNKVKVNALAYQFLEKISAMSEDQLMAITDNYQTGYMMNVSDRSALDNYVLKKSQASVINEIKDIKIDLNARLSAANLMITIIILFAIIMSIVIVTMMTQASLTEQKRLISTMRTLGFTIDDISIMWLKQEAVFFAIGAAIGFPLGLVCQKIMDRVLINDSWSFPYVCTVWDVLIVVGFILLILLGAHFFSLRLVKKWNLADNMRSRE